MSPDCSIFFVLLLTTRSRSQAQELRIYFKSLGAEISDEKSPRGIEDDLHKIIGVCDACFKDGNETEIETILNDIVSIMIHVRSFLYRSSVELFKNNN